MNRIITIRDPGRYGLSRGIDGSWRSGALDCFVCALRCLSGVKDPSNQFEPTIRDAHVWLYWAEMTKVSP